MKLHLTWLRLDVKIEALYGTCKSRFFSTDKGTPWRDCANASKFTFYQVKSRKTANTVDTPSLEGHNTTEDQISKSHYIIVPQSYQIDIG